ncbi:MAG: NAD(P)/FAD-dependent oxidoreductase [Phormidesmis sp.]
MSSPQLAPKLSDSANANTETALPVVIIGGGFVGLFTALHLRHRHFPNPIILIDSQTQFVFKPLLYEYLSGEMEATEVVPTYEELLSGSDITFVQGSVTEVDLTERKVRLAAGLQYSYQYLVLAVGSIQGYFGTEGAQQYAFAFRTQADAQRLKEQLRDRLKTASKTTAPVERKKLATVAIVGAGPSGVEMAATLADLLPGWYARLGGKPQDIRVVLVNHGDSILSGDVNEHLQETALAALKKRTVPVELLLGVGVEAVSAKGLSYRPKGEDSKPEQQDQNALQQLSAATVIWTAGTGTNPLIESLPLEPGDRDKHKSPLVMPTLQLLNYPDVFAAGDCAVVQAQPQPAVAQIAYQQGAGIAHNLLALAKGESLKPVHPKMRGTLMKLGIRNGVANLFDKVQIGGEAGDLIRNATYLEMLPTPVHNFKATAEWLTDDIFERNQKVGKIRRDRTSASHAQPLQPGRVAVWMSGAVLLASIVIGLFLGLGPQRSPVPSARNSQPSKVE